MIEMTLSSRHRIRNSCPGGLRPSTLPLGHESLSEELQIYLNLWSVDILSISAEQVSQPDMQVGVF